MNNLIKFKKFYNSLPHMRLFVSEKKSFFGVQIQSVHLLL